MRISGAIFGAAIIQRAQNHGRLLSTFFTNELCGKADDASADAPRHSRAIRSVSKVATIGVRYGVKGVGSVSD